jgi:hypothetical protein
MTVPLVWDFLANARIDQIVSDSSNFAAARLHKTVEKRHRFDQATTKEKRRFVPIKIQELLAGIGCC